MLRRPEVSRQTSAREIRTRGEMGQGGENLLTSHSGQERTSQVRPMMQAEAAGADEDGPSSVKEAKRLVPHPPSAPRSDRSAARAPAHVREPAARTNAAYEEEGSEELMEKLRKESSDRANDESEIDKVSAPVIRPTPPARGRQGQAAVRLAINRKLEKKQTGSEDRDVAARDGVNEADDLMSRRKRNILLKWWRQQVEDVCSVSVGSALTRFAQARAFAELAASDAKEKRAKREEENMKVADEMIEKVRETLLQVLTSSILSCPALPCPVLSLLFHPLKRFYQINDRMFDISIVQRASKLLEQARSFIEQQDLRMKQDALSSLQARVQQAEEEVQNFRRGEKGLRTAEEALRAGRWREVEEEAAAARECFEMAGALDKVFVVSQLLQRAGVAKRRREYEERAEMLLEEGESALRRGNVREAKEKAEKARGEVEQAEGGSRRLDKLLAAISEFEEERRLKGFREEGKLALEDARECLQEGNVDDARTALKKSRRLMEEGRCVEEFQDELTRMELLVAERIESKDWRRRSAACLQEAEERLDKALRSEVTLRKRLLEESVELSIKCKVMMEHVQEVDMKRRLEELTVRIEEAVDRTDKILQLEGDLDEAKVHLEKGNMEIAANFLSRAEQVGRESGLEHRREEMVMVRRRIEEERERVARQQLVLSMMKQLNEILNNNELEEETRAKNAREALARLMAEISSSGVELEEETKRELERIRDRLEQSEQLARRLAGAEEDLEMAREFLRKEELKLARLHAQASEEAFEAANDRGGRERVKEILREVERMEKRAEMRLRLREARELLLEEEFEQAEEKVKEARR
eukprot:751279-Hanusia_phi.AAC.1